MELDKSFVWKNLRKDLAKHYGESEAAAIWHYAGNEFQKLEFADPNADDSSRSFVFPAVALYRAIDHFEPGKALEVMRSYGTETGLRMKRIFRVVTALPGMPTLMWKNMDKIASKMSAGYDCENLVVNEHECRLDVVMCPLYEKAKKLGTPEAVQAICCMDKVYMTGFRGIEYVRTKSVAEGDDCCDYRMKDSRRRR